MKSIVATSVVLLLSMVTLVPNHTTQAFGAPAAVEWPVCGRMDARIAISADVRLPSSAICGKNRLSLPMAMMSRTKSGYINMDNFTAGTQKRLFIQNRTWYLEKTRGAPHGGAVWKLKNTRVAASNYVSISEHGKILRQSGGVFMTPMI